MAKPPRIIGTETDPETGELWAVISTVGSPADPYLKLRVPEHAADAVVELIILAHEQLQEIVDSCTAGNSGWRARLKKVSGTLAKLERTVRGRPRDAARNARIVELAREHRKPDGTPNIYKIAKLSGASWPHVREVLAQGVN